MTTSLASVDLHFEYDVVLARRRARQVAALVGFDRQDQTRISTVASEITRNALRYGGGGSIDFSLDDEHGPAALVVTVIDRGPGILNLDSVLAGRYQSATGMGIGIAGARRLMDAFDITSSPEKGTCIVMRKLLPRGADVSRERLRHMVDELATQRTENPFEEIQQQNAELLQALSSLNTRQEELQRLNQELEDTNRGVLALYADIDEKAESLRRTDQLKTRFLSDMSHEFRTPVNSILALCTLLEETDLGTDQAKQVRLIRRAADDLAGLVSDLLDLAKIEAGKIEVRPALFEVPTLFSALRGMLRPLLANRSVSLIFEEPEELPSMFTDEAKVSQILRNFISNALKFTEAGEIRISAALASSGIAMVFSVADTGIGIAEEDHERIFEEFTQIDSPLQRKQKGTGLGLPLTRKLATLLGGTVGVRSRLGSGSTFWAEIPLRYTGSDAAATAASEAVAVAAHDAAIHRRILIIDDDETARYTLGSFARATGTEIIEAENGLQGIARAQTDRPDIILLDMMMPGIGGHEVLQRLKTDPLTAAIPVVVVTSRFVNDDERRQILTRAAAVVSKGELSREVIMKAIDEALAKASS